MITTTDKAEIIQLLQNNINVVDDEQQLWKEENISVQVIYSTILK